MKKFATIFVLLFVLSVSAFAEGQYPIGGKSCPQGQPTCLVDGGEIPLDEKPESPIYQDLLDFFKAILG